MTPNPRELRRPLIGGLLALLTVAAACGPGAVPSRGTTTGEVVPFDIARIHFELNATAEDAGIQMLVDGEGWEWIKVKAPDGDKAIRVRADGSVGDIGVTELFFESAEPSLDDLPLEDLLAMFPEGDYQVVGRTAEGDRMEGSATLTHVIPAGPEVTAPAEGAVTDPAATVISWEPVTQPSGVEIVRYQVIVEREDPLRVFSVDLPADRTSVTVPAEYLEAGTDYKLEVIAVEVSDNQTITESTFRTA